MSVLYVRARDLVVPAAFSVNFNDIADTDGPFTVGIIGWVSTADVLAGVLDFTMNYEDPTGATREVLFGTTPRLFLNDSTSFFATDMVTLQRLSGSSVWTLDAALVSGIAGSALISYRVIHSSAAVGDLQAW